MLARVSHLEAFRQWRLDDESTVDDIVQRITSSKATPAMKVGTAFHKALELAQPGEHDTLQAMGYTFVLSDGVLALPRIRELRTTQAYGDLQVTGQVDILDGNAVEDHKTTAQMDAERYFDGFQWRFYLDMFGASVFRWNVFKLLPPRKKDPPKTYRVDAPQVLTQYRYPGMHEDCAALAADFHAFAQQHLRGWRATV